MPGLTLRRKVGESIKIGNDIVVTVVGVHLDNAQINIVAPHGVEITRPEVELRRRRREVELHAEARHAITAGQIAVARDRMDHAENL